MTDLEHLNINDLFERQSLIFQLTKFVLVEIFVKHFSFFTCIMGLAEDLEVNS